MASKVSNDESAPSTSRDDASDDDFIRQQWRQEKNTKTSDL